MSFPRLNLLDDNGDVVFRFNSVTEGVSQTLQTILDPDNFDLASPDYDPEIFFGTSGIGTVVHAQEQTALMTFRVWCRAANALVYRKEVGRITELLRNGPTLEWVLGPDPEDMRFIDVLTLAEIPQPFRSESGVRHIVMGGYDTGFDVALIRQGDLRGPIIDSDVNQLANGTMILDMNDDGRADSPWAWSSTTNITNEHINSENEAYGFDIATTSSRTFQQMTPAGTFLNGQNTTFQYLVRKAVVEETITARARAVMQFFEADGTTPVGSEVLGTLTNLNHNWVRLTVSGQAGVNSSRVRVGIRFENATSGNRTVYVKHAQVERRPAGQGGTLTPFREGSMTIMDMIASTATFARTSLPIFIQGDAPTDVDLYMRGLSSDAQGFLITYKEPQPDITKWINKAFLKECESGTLGTDTTSVAATSGSNGNTARVSFSTNNTLSPARATVQFGHEVESLNGEHEVWLRLRKQGGTTTNNEYEVRVDSFVDSSAVKTGQVVPFTPGGGTTASGRWHLMPAGRIVLPLHRHPTTITLRIHARRTLGPDGLDLDAIFVLPPEHIAKTSGANVGTGQDLITHPDSGEAHVINAVTEDFMFHHMIEGRVPITSAPPGLGSLHRARFEMMLNGGVLRQGAVTAGLVGYRYFPRYRQ